LFLLLILSLEFCPLTPVAFSSSFFPVFYNSGFKQTLCGGAWLSLTGSSNAFNNLGSSTARYGCCDAGTYMANPELNPFVKTNACQNCLTLGDNPTENSHTSCSGGTNGGGEGENGDSVTTVMVQESVVPLFEWLGSLLFLVGIWLGNAS
jgi:hypothetical protein